MKKITILGSTGSIGVQTLDIISRDSELELVAMSANKNIELFEQQIRKFMPKIVAVADESSAKSLKLKIADLPIKVLSGSEGVAELAAFSEAQMVVAAIVGIAGLIPTLAAINAGKDIALANKETLVTAGDIVMAAVKEKNVSILPVDSEHSAIFQCLQGQVKPKKIILTASGGPFFGKTKDELIDIQPKQALKHPNWSMGSKISIDSATLMNKGLEVIEASHLFDVDVKDIEVVVHPQSIIHSMVSFVDNSILAQLGAPDMRTPISYALNYPKRGAVSGAELDIYSLNNLTFGKPDTNTFRSLPLAYRAATEGGTATVVLNGANEAAVELFLSGGCKFLQIAQIVEESLNALKIVKNPKLDDIIQADKEARNFVKNHRWS